MQKESLCFLGEYIKGQCTRNCSYNDYSCRQNSTANFGMHSSVETTHPYRV